MNDLFADFDALAKSVTGQFSAEMAALNEDVQRKLDRVEFNLNTATIEAETRMQAVFDKWEAFLKDTPLLDERRAREEAEANE